MLDDAAPPGQILVCEKRVVLRQHPALPDFFHQHALREPYQFS